MASKIFAVLFPIILIVIVNTDAVFDLPILWLILNYMISMLFIIPERHSTSLRQYRAVAISLTAGSILLVLILVKYIKTRRLTTRRMRRSGWWHSESSQQASNLESGTNFGSDSSDGGSHSIYDQALITRFGIGFVLLA